eukprot:scaffold1492_cov257-Pinguiococcus_pyrenoidosus.AAC.3
MRGENPSGWTEKEERQTDTRKALWLDAKYFEASWSACLSSVISLLRIRLESTSRAAASSAFPGSLVWVQSCGASTGLAGVSTVQLSS